MIDDSTIDLVRIDVERVSTLDAPVKHFDLGNPHVSRHKAMWLLLRSHGDTKSNSFDSIVIMKGLVDGECWHSVYFGDVAAGLLCLRS